MEIHLTEDQLSTIHSHGEENYPEEGVGLLLGREKGHSRIVVDILPLVNGREVSARYNRYLITPQSLFDGEKKAESRNLEVIGVFHSHPDHSNRPSEFDREWAVPWFSYIITSVFQGKADRSRSWRLANDRDQFLEETIVVLETVP